MTKPSRGDVWLTDMGIAGKVRPCLLLTDHSQDDELALITGLPHTTALRGNRWEVEILKSFLKPGAFHLQQIQSLSLARLVRILGRLDDFEMDVISARLRERLAG
jgi:mRNA interferase MazF